MMNNRLANKLSTFNPQHPYIWEMRITEDEFVSLENESLGRLEIEISKIAKIKPFIEF